MKVNQSSQKINLKSNSSQGMEVFLTPETNPVSQSKPKEEQPKPKVLDKQPKIEEPDIQITKAQTKAKDNSKMEEEIQGKIEEIERELKIKTTLDLTTFNNIAHNKQLLFKVLFIRQKIYLHVKDNNGRSTIIAINVPRFGGTSLRYMISQCVLEYCRIIEKKTNKGVVLSYSPISTSSSNVDDIEDIFD